MSYVPTIEDIAYLAENQPDKFSSPVRTLRAIRGALANGNDSVGQEAHTVQMQYGNYLENGGQPLEESPIPSDSNDQEGEGLPLQTPVRNAYRMTGAASGRDR